MPLERDAVQPSANGARTGDEQTGTCGPFADQAASLETFACRAASLHDKLAECHPSLKRGQVWCRSCGHTQRVDAAELPVIERVGRFVEMMTEKPLKLADDFYAIHVGTEWEAELRLSDLRALVDAWNTRIASQSCGVTEEMAGERITRRMMNSGSGANASKPPAPPAAHPSKS